MLLKKSKFITTGRGCFAEDVGTTAAGAGGDGDGEIE